MILCVCFGDIFGISARKLDSRRLPWKDSLHISMQQYTYWNPTDFQSMHANTRLICESAENGSDKETSGKGNFYHKHHIKCWYAQWILFNRMPSIYNAIHFRTNKTIHSLFLRLSFPITKMFNANCILYTHINIG